MVQANQTENGYEIVQGSQPYIEVWDGHVMVVRIFDGSNVVRMEEASNWEELEEEARAAIRLIETPVGGVFYPCPPELAERAIFVRDLDEWITVSEAHRISGVPRDLMLDAIIKGRLTARLDDRSLGSKEKQKVRRSRVLELWPREKTNMKWSRKVQLVDKGAGSVDGVNDVDEAARKERFWDKVETGDANVCWPWQGGRTGRGYGTFWADGMARAAHKVAYEISKGPVPKGKYVRHTCDTVLCVNPAHLELSDKKC